MDLPWVGEEMAINDLEDMVSDSVDVSIIVSRHFEECPSDTRVFANLEEGWGAVVYHSDKNCDEFNPEWTVVYPISHAREVNHLVRCKDCTQP